MTEIERSIRMAKEMAHMRESLNTSYEEMAERKHPASPFVTGQLEAVTFVMKALEDTKDLFGLEPQLTLPELMVEMVAVLQMRAKGIEAMMTYLKFNVIPRVEIDIVTEREEQKS